jgi:3-hydroxyacyl-CoA dehydrogenase
MAKGAFAVQDLAGIDIAMASRHVFGALEEPRTRNSRIMEMLFAQGRLGRKTGAGWYRYDGKSAQVDPDVAAIIERAAGESGTARRPITPEEIIERTVYALVNEGARIIEERYAQRASDIDLAYINGYGFLSFRGGPMHLAKSGISFAGWGASQARLLPGTG